MVKFSPSVNITVDLSSPLHPTSVTYEEGKDEVIISGTGFECSLRKFKYPFFYFDKSKEKVEFGYKYRKQDRAWYIELIPGSIQVHPEKQSALPLYYYSDNHKLYASSDFAHLAERLIPYKLKPNIPVLVEHLMLQSNLHDETILEGIHVLYENSYLEITTGNVEKKWYPSQGLSKVLETKISSRKAVKEMQRLLGNVINYHLSNLNDLNLNFGNSLSGGKDSATVAHVTYLLHKKPLNYFSLVQPQPQKRVQIKRLESFAQNFAGTLNLIELENFPLLPRPNAYILRNPRLEIYLEATHASATQAEEQGIAALFTGFGGDELFLIDMFEEEGFAGIDLVAKRQKTEVPFFFGKKLDKIYKEAKFAKAYPEPLVAHSVRGANYAYNPVWHNHTIWPISPLGDLELTKFCRSLPKNLRENKELFNVHHRQNSFPEPFLYVTSKDTFRPFYIDFLTKWGLEHLEKTLKNSPLADMGLILPDRILKDFKYNILPQRGGSGLTGVLFTILNLDMFFKNYKKGGKQNGANSNDGSGRSRSKTRGR